MTPDEIQKQRFIEQCERSIARPLEQRLKYGFVGVANREKVNRSFSSMAEYREFCEKHYPEYMGYGRP